MPLVRRTVLLGLAAGFLAACDPAADLSRKPVDLGDFRLGYNIVVARNPKLVPGSRKATEAEWQAAVTKAIADRFGRYEGTRLYHFGISVDVYNLAAVDVPGVPSPKSALAVTANIWDDAKGVKLNEEAEQLTAVSLFNIGGVQPTKEKQLEFLAELIAREVEEWLLENPQWFEDAPAE